MFRSHRSLTFCLHFPSRKNHMVWSVLYGNLGRFKRRVYVLPHFQWVFDEPKTQSGAPYSLCRMRRKDYGRTIQRSSGTRQHRCLYRPKTSSVHLHTATTIDLSRVYGVYSMGTTLFTDTSTVDRKIILKKTFKNFEFFSFDSEYVF